MGRAVIGRAGEVRGEVGALWVKMMCYLGESVFGGELMVVVGGGGDGSSSS